MIHALRSEGPGQRFEPHEWQSREGQDKHIHLHFHVHLSFRAHQGRFSHLSVTRMMRILAALFGATLIAMWFWGVVDDTHPISWLLPITGHLILTSLCFAWGAMVLGGIPLLFSGWRSKPHVRFGLFISLILLILTFFQPLLTVPLPVLLSFLGFSRAFEKGEIAGTWLRFASRLSFVAVGAMVLALLGGFLWCLSLMLVMPMMHVLGQDRYSWSVLLPLLLGMCLAVIVAVHALFSRPRLREGTQARPKDTSPSDFDSSQEPHGYRG